MFGTASGWILAACVVLVFTGVCHEFLPPHSVLTSLVQWSVPVCLVCAVATYAKDDHPDRLQ